MIRRVFVFLHRWVGLAMALFLVIEGPTGSLLAFRGDLTRLFDPALAGRAALARRAAPRPRDAD